MGKTWHKAKLIKDYKNLKRDVEYTIQDVLEGSLLVKIEDTWVPIFLLESNCAVKGHNSAYCGTALSLYRKSSSYRVFVFNKFYTYQSTMYTPHKRSCLFYNANNCKLPTYNNMNNVICGDKAYYVTEINNGMLMNDSSFVTRDGKSLKSSDITEFIYENMTSYYISTQEKLEKEYPMLKQSKVDNSFHFKIVGRNGTYKLYNRESTKLLVCNILNDETLVINKGDYHLLLPNGVNNLGYPITVLSYNRFDNLSLCVNNGSSYSWLDNLALSNNMLPLPIFSREYKYDDTNGLTYTNGSKVLGDTLVNGFNHHLLGTFADHNILYNLNTKRIVYNKCLESQTDNNMTTKYGFLGVDGVTHKYSGSLEDYDWSTILPNAILINTNEPIISLCSGETSGNTNLTGFIKDGSVGTTSIHNVKFVTSSLSSSNTCKISNGKFYFRGVETTNDMCGWKYNDDPVYIFGDFGDRKLAWNINKCKIIVVDMSDLKAIDRSTSTKIDHSKSTAITSFDVAESMAISFKYIHIYAKVKLYTKKGSYIDELHVTFDKNGTDSTVSPNLLIDELGVYNAIDKTTSARILAFAKDQHGIISAVDKNGLYLRRDVKDITFVKDNNKYSVSKRNNSNMDLVNLTRVKCENISQVNRVIKQLTEYVRAKHGSCDEYITYYDIYANICKPAYSTFKELGNEYNVWFDKVEVNTGFVNIAVTRDAKKSKYRIGDKDTLHHTLSLDEFKELYTVESTKEQHDDIPEYAKVTVPMTEKDMVDAIFGDAVTNEPMVEKPVEKPQKKTSKLDW